MIENIEEFEEMISDLIALKIEGGYWDFKEQWYSNKGNLLHDIICFANNIENRDAYIIIGVQDKTGEIVSIKNDENRKNQVELTNFLRDKKFAGGIRPTVYVHTINNDIDVIIIKNTTNTPYYLSHKFEKVREGNIYTRIQDSNTAIDMTADVDKVSYLWKKRFGIDLTPFEKARFLLKNPKDWIPMGTNGVHPTKNDKYKRIWFNEQNPEFKLRIQPQYFSGPFKEDADFYPINIIDQNFYWLATISNLTSESTYELHNAYYWEISLEYLSTVIYTTSMISSSDFERVQWKNSYIKNAEDIACSLLYSYVEKDNIDFLLDNWLAIKQDTVERTKSTETKSSLDIPYYYHWNNNPYNVVPVFEDLNERIEFEKFVHHNQEEFFKEIGLYDKKSSPNTNMAQALDPHHIAYLCKSGEMLVHWLQKWREITYKNRSLKNNSENYFMIDYY